MTEHHLVSGAQVGAPLQQVGWAKECRSTCGVRTCATPAVTA
jgi:hypothetical protein